MSAPAICRSCGQLIEDERHTCGAYVVIADSALKSESGLWTVAVKDSDGYTQYFSSWDVQVQDEAILEISGHWWVREDQEAARAELKAAGCWV